MALMDVWTFSSPQFETSPSRFELQLGPTRYVIQTNWFLWPNPDLHQKTATVTAAHATNVNTLTPKIRDWSGLD